MCDLGDGSCSVPLLLTGVELVRKALRIPCHTIAANAGVDADDVVTRVMRDTGDMGYDALHDTYVDMMKSGIIDPTKVLLVTDSINKGGNAIASIPSGHSVFGNDCPLT